MILQFFYEEKKEIKGKGRKERGRLTIIDSGFVCTRRYV